MGNGKTYLVAHDCKSGCRKRPHVIFRQGTQLELDSDNEHVRKWIKKGYLKEIPDADILHDNQAVKTDNDE